MPILDSAHNGRPDPQDKLNPPMAVCACGCGQDIYRDDDEIYMLDGFLLADKDCIVRYSGAVRIYLWT